MEIMLVKMTVSTGLYILITVFAWRLWSRHRQSVFAKVAIGVIFGLCSIASTHLGVNYKSMILNVRDIGPLAAGLYFDPVSGIIAGLIGGIERYIAGTYYGVGEFTTKACSLSTCLAGFLSAVLKLTLYKDQVIPANNVAANARLSGAASGTNAGTSSAADAGTAATITKPVYPFMMQSFFIGAVMEVFHMYAVLITHRDHMHMAARVVRVCSLPMIIFSGLGLMICSYLIRRLSGETYERIPFTDYERTPIATRFHRRMLIVLLVLFSINHLMDINFYIHASRQDAESYLRRLATDCQQLYDDMADEPGKAAQLLPYVAMAMNDNALYLLYDKGQNIVSSLYRDDSEPDRLPDDDYAICKDNLKSGVFRCNLHYYGGMDLLCITRQLDNDLFLLIGWRFDAIIEDQINRSYETLLSDILLFTVLYLLITELVNALVVKNLKSVNRSLLKIIEGDLDEKVDVHNSIEFVHLSDDINQTVSTLKGYIDESEHRMEQELKMAATIQEAVLPHVFKYPRDDFEIFALMKPARQVGGDFYDFFFIDADVLALVIADVSGKGIPAAMFMMRAKAAIGNAARTGISTDKILTEVNNFLCEGNEAEMFVTVWIGIIDLTTGVMQCSNAGHEYPVLYRAGEKYELLKDRHSLVLAAMEDAPMSSYEIRFNKGDRLFIYTDGATEAINKNCEAYGTGRIVTKLNTLRHVSEEQALHALHHDIDMFVGGTEQFDDITLMGFTYLGTPSENFQSTDISDNFNDS